MSPVLSLPATTTELPVHAIAAVVQSYRGTAALAAGLPGPAPNTSAAPNIRAADPASASRRGLRVNSSIR